MAFLQEQVVHAFHLDENVVLFQGQKSIHRIHIFSKYLFFFRDDVRLCALLIVFHDRNAFDKFHNEQQYPCAH